MLQWIRQMIGLDWIGLDWITVFVLIITATY
jgi:hypothetical protein